MRAGVSALQARELRLPPTFTGKLSGPADWKDSAAISTPRRRAVEAKIKRSALIPSDLNRSKDTEGRRKRKKTEKGSLDASAIETRNSSPSEPRPQDGVGRDDFHVVPNLSLSTSPHFTFHRPRTILKPNRQFSRPCAGETDVLASKGTKKAGGSLHRPATLSPPRTTARGYDLCCRPSCAPCRCACRGLPSPRRRRTCCLACRLCWRSRFPNTPSHPRSRRRN